MKKLIGPFLWLILLMPSLTFGQNSTEIMPKGSRSAGMANANTTLVDAWSVFNNIGAMGNLNQSEVFCSYDHRLGLNELTTLAAGATYASPIGNLGLSISHYGGDLFNQQVIGLGFAHKMGIGSLGIKASYFQTNMEGYGRSGQTVLELGGMAELGPTLSFGAHIYNLSRAKISNNTSDYLPTIVKAGLSFTPNDKLIANIEAEKDILLDPTVKLGLEYGFSRRFWARCGIRSQPSNLHFGIGFKPDHFSIDYAMGQNNQLGFTHHFSFNYAFISQ
ncbi:PorV/PorQ family protein [Echinicola sediminis]